MQDQPQSEEPPPESNLSSIATELMLHRHQKGDPRAMDKLFFRIRGRLLAAIRDHPTCPYLPPTHNIEDVLQDLWMAVFTRKSLDTFKDKGPGSLRAFLRRCLDFTMIDICRRASADKRGGNIPHQELDAGASSAAGPPPLVVREPGPATVAECRDWQDRALRLLTGQDREVWRLRFVDDLDYDDIAARLRISQSAVRSAYHRALGKLF